MAISTRDAAAGGLPAERSSPTAPGAHAGSTPDQPAPGADTDLDRAAKRFGALLHARPEAKAMADGTSEFGGSRAREPSHPANGHRGQQDTRARISDPAARTAVSDFNDLDIPAARQTEPALEDGSAQTPHPLENRPHVQTTIKGEYTRASMTAQSTTAQSMTAQSTTAQSTQAVDGQSPRMAADEQPARAPTAATARFGDSSNEPPRPAQSHFPPDALTQVSAAKGAAQPASVSKARDSEASPSSGSFPSGDRILQGFSQQGAAAVENLPTPAPRAVQTSDRIEQIERLGERLAQRILVSDRSQIGTAEVRIQLRESVLEGGEIRLYRDQGQLVVSIQIPSTDLARQLSGQTDTLQQTLANRLETPVRVEVQVVGARDTGSDASPGDGRSRNRRDPWETDEDPGA